MDFLPFDPEVDVSRKRRRLPHWFQEGRTYFVTFRLADSLPKSKRDEINEERMDWLNAHGIASIDEIASLPRNQQHQYRSRFTRKIEALLDQGLGSCVLKDPSNAKVVADAFGFFDEERYHLDEFVIMPNHIHLLVCPIAPFRLSQVLHSWKRHSAREINRRLNQTGKPLWLDESFDHIVRSTDQLEHFRRYIEQNPIQAHLNEGEYLRRESGAGF